ncbi:MAG: hypothetical protein ABJB47_04790 [Actinomycetota bacterium]
MASRSSSISRRLRSSPTLAARISGIFRLATRHRPSSRPAPSTSIANLSPYSAIRSANACLSNPIQRFLSR